MDRREFLLNAASASVLGTSVGYAAASHGVDRPEETHPFEAKQSTYSCELLVVGASSAGTVAALTAGRLGVKTVLAMRSPRELGGLQANGLNPDSDMDVRCIGGFAQEMDLLGRVATGVQIEETKYVAPPHDIFRYFRQEFEKLPNVTIIADYYPVSVQKEGRRLAGVTFHHRKDPDRSIRVQPKLTIDAEIEGDVAYLAGVSMTLKREGKQRSEDPTRDREYSAGEIYTPERGSLAGGELLPASTFRADDVPRTMGWSGLLVLERREAKSPDNPWLLTRPPAGYRREDFEWVKGIGGVSLGERHYRFSMDRWSSYIEGWRMPDGRHVLESMKISDRETNERRHIGRLLGILYYAQHELGHTHWGLSAKSFREGVPPKYTLADFGTSTRAGGAPLPALIYMREGRRMVNDRVFGGRFMEDQGTPELFQKNYWNQRSFYFNAMNIDIHGTTNRFVEGSGPEGMQVPRFVDPTFGVCCIPFDVCIPRSSEVTGLYVASAGAYTHQAYAAFPRMEPGRFQIGEACALAAHTVLRSAISAHDVDVAEVQLLGLARSGHSIVYFDDAMPGTWGHTVDQMLGARGAPLRNAQGQWIDETRFTNAQALECMHNLFLRYVDEPLSQKEFNRVTESLRLVPDELARWGGILPALADLTGYRKGERYDSRIRSCVQDGFFAPDRAFEQTAPTGFHHFKRLAFNLLFSKKSMLAAFPIQTGERLFLDTFNRPNGPLGMPEIGPAYRTDGEWNVTLAMAQPETAERDTSLWTPIETVAWTASCDLFLDQTKTEASGGLFFQDRTTGERYRFLVTTVGFEVVATLDREGSEASVTLCEKRFETRLRGFTLRASLRRGTLHCTLGHEWVTTAALRSNLSITAVGLLNVAGRANFFDNFEVTGDTVSSRP